MHTQIENSRGNYIPGRSGFKRMWLNICCSGTAYKMNLTLLWLLFVFAVVHTRAHQIGTSHHDEPHHHAHYCSSCAKAAAGRLSRVSHVVEPFSLEESRLLPGSMEWTAQQTNLEYLLSLPVSSLAWNFLNTSGLPTPGQPFGGWETPYPSREGDDRGHFTGHFLSASALMVTASGCCTS